jgi:non-specific serine/threonine protein kinase/serine/threonine-protein kinase
MIAESYSSLGEYELAGTHFLAAADALRATHAPDGALARAIILHAHSISDKGQPQEALERGREALTLASRLPLEDADRLYVEDHFAGLERGVGQLEESRLRLLRVLDTQRRLFGEDDPVTLDMIENLAITLSQMGRDDEARPLLEKLLIARRARYGDEDTRTLGVVNSLAVIEMNQKNFARAEALLAPVLPIVERVLGTDHALTMVSINNMGSALRAQGRNEEARPYLQRVLDYALKNYGPTAFQTIVVESNLAQLLRDTGQLEPALQHARSAAEHADVTMHDNPIRATLHTVLATILTRLQRYPEAERELSTAWDVFTSTQGLGPTHPRAQNVVDDFIKLYTAWNKPDKVAQWQAKKSAESVTDSTQTH